MAIRLVIASAHRLREGVPGSTAGFFFMQCAEPRWENGQVKVRVSLRAYNALMSNRQHDIVVLVMIWLLSILAGLTLGLTRLML